MKPTIPQSIVLTIGLLAGTPLLSQAQTAPVPTKSKSPATSATIVTIPPASSYRTTNSNNYSDEVERESVTTLLNLASSRIAQLDRAYSTYARARLTQEAQIVDWQDELRIAQAATTFDERKASQLAGSVSGAENKIATAYLKARGEALAALTLAQRTQLEKIEAENRVVRDDKYRFLLLSQVEDLWRVPIDADIAEAVASAAGAARSVPAQQNYYYNVSPGYNYPLYSYGFGWNDFNYGFASPFYARPNHFGGFYGNFGNGGFYGNGGNYFGNNRFDNYNRVDRNARPRWNRTDNDSRPPVNMYTNPVPRRPEPSRPLYAPQNPGGGGSGGVSRPVPVPFQPQPQWERQRETPRQPESRPDPPRAEPTRPDPPRADPPRSSGSSSGSDGGSRWNRGGGGRGR